MEAETLFGEGIGLFAVSRAAESRGGQTARRDYISRLLQSYDEAYQNAAEGSLPAKAQDSSAVRTEALRAALFFVALEDLVGRENFDRAMLRLSTATAGSEVDANQWRSALEATTGTDLAPVFRRWLNQTDVPEDFRSRYAQQRSAT
jgi:hypothetical protein